MCYADPPTSRNHPQSCSLSPEEPKCEAEGGELGGNLEEGQQALSPPSRVWWGAVGSPIGFGQSRNRKRIPSGGRKSRHKFWRFWLLVNCLSLETQSASAYRRTKFSQIRMIFIEDFQSEVCVPRRICCGIKILHHGICFQALSYTLSFHLDWFCYFRHMWNNMI